MHAWQHARLAAVALAVASVLGGIFGSLASSIGWLRTPIIGAATVGRTIPSIALLTLALPLLGVGMVPALAALTALALPPIVINTDLALRGVAPPVLDVARALGMSRSQRFVRIAAPLALPVALAGVRTASVEVIGSATLATFIGAGGLGDDIVRALQTSDLSLLIVSSITVALMAFVAEAAFSRAARVAERAQ